MSGFTNPLEDPEWDEKLVVRRESSFFHGAAWGKVLQATYGHHPTYFKYDLNADRFVTDRDLSSGWYNWVFRSMPSALLRLTGALLCRHLSSWAVAPERCEWSLIA